MAMLPRILAIDFTHTVIGRDYMFQSLLPGVPAPEALAACPRPQRASFCRQLGSITAAIQSVRGTRFGRVAGPAHDTWSQAITGYLNDVTADLDAAGLDAADMRQVIAAAGRDSAVLDEITEPRLLHGDLRDANVMIQPGDPEPVFCGVLDWDRASWGDPAFDWANFLAAMRPGTETGAFWDTCGTLPSTPAAARRNLCYQACHIGTARAERHRLRRPTVPATYDQMRPVFRNLRAP